MRYNGAWLKAIGMAGLGIIMGLTTACDVEEPTVLPTAGYEAPSLEFQYEVPSYEDLDDDRFHEDVQVPELAPFVPDTDEGNEEAAEKAHERVETPSASKTPTPTAKAPEKADRGQRGTDEGDDDRNGWISEDESGWDCNTMGNRICGDEIRA